MSREASSPPARPRSSKRGGCLDVRPWHASVPLSLQPLRELERGRLLGRDGLPLPAPLPRLLLPAHHSTLRDMMSQGKFRRTAPLLNPPVFPDLRIEEQGRIAELALGRTALVTVAVVLALTPLPVRGQEIGGGRPLGHCPPASSHDLRITPALGVCALVLGETGLDPRIDTGLAGTALGVTGRQHARSPTRGHAIFLVILVTARGRVDDHLPPLTVRGQRREDGEPDVSSRRVWRR